MRKIYPIFVLCLASILPLTVQAFPPKKGDKACLDCHKLDKKEAEAIVKKVVPTGTVTDIKQSPIKGVWQIDVDAGEGKRGALYLDFSKKNVIAGQIVSLENLAKQPQPPKKVDVSKIPRGDVIIVGPKDAAKKVVVFTDPDCPYCRELHKIMKQVLAKRNDVVFEIVLNPLPMHKDAYKKAQVIQCSKSLEMLDDAFAGKPVPEPPEGCTGDVIDKNKALAASLGFSGTPTLVRDDGTVLFGYLPDDKLEEWIDKKQ